MSVQLINGHVLIPHSADWSSPVQWSRQWENEISGALTGHESRAALRSQPRVKLGFAVLPLKLQEQAQFDDRIRQAKKSGLACVPYYSRGGVLTANVVGSPITVADCGYTWKANSYVFLMRDDNFDVFEAIQVTAANLAGGIWTLTLSGAPTNTYLAGMLAWPLLLGEFACDSMNALTSRNGTTSITVRELVSSQSEAIGEIAPDASEGIGHWTVGDTLVVQ